MSRYIVSDDHHEPGEKWWMGEPAARLERSVLGSLLICGNLLPKVRAVISREDFVVDGHRAIFDAMCVVEKTGVDPDLVLVAHELAKNPRVSAPGFAYITMLVDHIPAVDSVVAYAKRVKECSVMRRAESAGHRRERAVKERDL